jgi:hypothetical protein
VLRIQVPAKVRQILHRYLFPARSREQYSRNQIEHTPNKSSELWCRQAIPKSEAYHGVGKGENSPRELLKLEMVKGKFYACYSRACSDICATEADDLLFKKIQVRSLFKTYLNTGGVI